MQLHSILWLVNIGLNVDMLGSGHNVLIKHVR